MTEGQKDALRLARHGDIKRFFDRVNKARETFLNMEQDNDNRNINEAYQLASPLQQELTQGIFGDGSLVQKVTRYVMTEEQATELEEREIEQFRALFSAQASLFLATLGRSMALTAKQQRQLQGHLKKRIEQIQKTPSGKLHVSFYQTVFIKWIAESQEEEATSILDPEQTKVIENLAENARAALPMLKKEGLIQ
ncbi:hypothetical protein [Rhodopirellula bahusiensis]|uniref:hypothetical protein n=1 Tax=Rhodopirellula bahusiensis TaxID=2014065 RepID=UPI0032968300